MRQLVSRAASITLLGLSFACAAPSSPIPSASSCPSGTAAILIYDGALGRGCGCTEGAGTVSAGGAFACTVTAGTSVSFFVVSTRVAHQVVFSSAPVAVPASPIYRPSRRLGETRAFGVNLSTPGTYVFTDTFNSALSGTLTVL